MHARALTEVDFWQLQAGKRSVLHPALPERLHPSGLCHSWSGRKSNMKHMGLLKDSAQRQSCPFCGLTGAHEVSETDKELQNTCKHEHV